MAPRSAPDPSEVEAHMREMFTEAGLAQPDEVVHEAALDELHFRWTKQKLCVIVELTNR
jgi:hypothetical protein